MSGDAHFHGLEPTTNMTSSFANNWNLTALEDAYARWRQDPSSVDEKWRIFLEGFELAGARPAPVADGACVHMGVTRLIDAYRDIGHLLAHLDPLNRPPAEHPLLELSDFFGPNVDVNKVYETGLFLGLPQGTLPELVKALRETYCRTIGVEFRHIQDRRVRQWLQERMEPRRNRPNFPQRKKLRILMNLHFAELFEKFLHTRFVGQKRFSLEGAETLIPLLDAVVEKAADDGVREVILGMAHRGRLNVLANILDKPYQEIFSEFEDNFLPDSMDGDGDVKYHVGFSNDVTSAHGNPIHLSLTPNPSHLEAVDPVVEGRTRAKQYLFGDSERKLGIPLLIHGDAAFAGQGLVAETLNLSQLEGYQTGGTIHVIINNLIGFTTSPSDARSTLYCTDVAKMIQVPIFHVNGEDPEAVVYVAELALDFRQTFHQDVVIDMHCYRRHGHNEGDEPSFTQPVMYRIIKEKPTLSEIYTEQLILRGDLTVAETEAIDQQFHEKLQSALQEVKGGPPRRRGSSTEFNGRWKHLANGSQAEPVLTAVPYDTLLAVTEGMTRVPEGFHVHPKIARLLEARREEVRQHGNLDWALAEALAFGTLLIEGTPVRLSGQDSRRGTFSQRHSVLFDAETGVAYHPLPALAPDQAPFMVYDSLLSEAAVLGFEFGYSLDEPQTLVLWEAQFGDFANGAQVIIDQFISCSTSKWHRHSGLVMLLPHGYEGQGPEHSSARIERFLQLCAEDNMQVCNATTPAQYFHLLRRQMRRDLRLPLVLMTPKSLLRHKRVMSPVNDLTAGRFLEVIEDATADPGRVRRVLLCSGKVYYDLLERRLQDESGSVAIVRVEQLYPFPEEQLRGTLARYRRAHECVWVQEESQNMGAWSFMEPRLRAMGHAPEYVGRDASSSPATGSLKTHQREQQELVEAALRGQLPHVVGATRDGGQRLRASQEQPAVTGT
jgi:2-oxoglutarate dehydrogenase E1 component